jgi:hypothetical protein
VVDDGLGQHGDWDTHVFVACHWRAKIKVFEVASHELSIGIRNDTVEQQFVGNDVGSFCCHVAREINAITADSPADTTGVFFFGMKGRHDAEISGLASFWNLGPINEEESIGAFGITKTLGQASNFLDVRGLPERSFAAFAQLFVLGDLIHIRVEGIAMKGKMLKWLGASNIGGLSCSVGRLSFAKSATET